MKLSNVKVLVKSASGNDDKGN